MLIAIYICTLIKIVLLMKNIKLLVVLIVFGFTVNLSAQSAGTTTENTAATADLLVAMTLTEEASLNFGSSLLSDATGGTVILPSNSITREYTGGVVTSAATPAPTNADFNVTGTGLEVYNVTLPATVSVTHTTVLTGVVGMVISALTVRFNGASADATQSTLSALGTDSFTIGGTLTVQLNQVGGQYAGSFPVSVDYN